MKQYQRFFLLLFILFSLPFLEAKEERPLYPDLFKCWKKGPLVKENFAIPPGRCYASPKELVFYKRIYRELKDPKLKAGLIRELAQLENRDLGKIFFSFFLKEEDPLCRKEFLNTLEKWSRKGIRIPPFPEAKINELMGIADPALKGSLFSLALQEKWDISLEKFLGSIDWKRDLHAARLLLADLKKLKGDKKAESGKLLRRKENEARLFGMALLWESLEEPDKEPLFRERLTGKDSLIYRLFLGKLVASSSKNAPELLVLLAQDKHPAVRLIIARNMIPHTGKKEAILAGYLGRSNPLFLRIASAKALGKGKSSHTLSLLLDTLKDPDPILRRTAREALVERNPSASFRNRIANETRTTPHSYMEGAAFFAALPDRKIAGAFFARLLQEKKHPQIMILYALKGLEEIGNPSYAPLAASYASSPSAEIRESCAGALGKMKNPKAVPALKRLLLDKDSNVSSRAYITLWQWGESLPFLQEIRRTLRSRNDTQAFARAGAIRCAGRLPEAHLRPLLKDLETLMLKECIVIPMMPRSYDLEEVRLSALLLLKERKEAAAKQLFRKSFAQLEKEAKDPDRGGEGTSIFEYIRQIRENMAGRKVIPSPAPDGQGIFSIKRMD